MTESEKERFGKSAMIRYVSGIDQPIYYRIHQEQDTDAHCARPGVEPRYRQPRRKKATRYYMDEFHLLLKEEQTAAYSVEIWKRFRKWGGIPTAITQNVKDLLSSREVENIFENSDFVLMLNQAQATGLSLQSSSISAHSR